MYTETGTLIMTPEELEALHPADPASAFTLEIRQATDDQIAEMLYRCRQDAANLPKASWISDMAKESLPWTKAKIPMLEAEVARRGMTLPHWV